MRIFNNMIKFWLNPKKGEIIFLVNKNNIYKFFKKITFNKMKSKKNLFFIYREYVLE